MVKESIAIIGGGPAGLYAAYWLAKKGLDVNVYEEHKRIGEPVQCAGIVSSEIGSVVEMKERFVLNRLNKVKVISKHRCAVLDVNDVVIDRAEFDRHLARMALKEGAKLNIGYKYIGADKGSAVLSDKNGKIFKANAEVIIGADGPCSAVAKSSGLFGKRRFYTGMQARVKGNFEKEMYEVWLGDICPGFFGWLIPESEGVARIGIAAKTPAANSKDRTSGKDKQDRASGEDEQDRIGGKDKLMLHERFSGFLKIKRIDEKDIIDRQAGLIPIYATDIAVQKGKVYLVGDAACHVKATTGGGIVPGLKAAKILAECVFGREDYESALAKSGIKRELWTHLQIRKALDRFSNKDYDRLVKMAGQNKVKNILKNVNRDLSSKLVVKLIFAEPRFLGYLRKVL